jgi:prophage antirepressor-like protein
MKNNIQTFHSDEFGCLEVLTIDGKPYFPATECASILGYRNPRKAIIDHCRSVTKRDTPHPQNPQKNMERSFIPEGDLYRLIVRSKLPSAIRFEQWVFETLLPTIRKHGAYVTSDILDDMLSNPKLAEMLMRKLDAERDKNAKLTKFAEELTSKALYCDIILQSKNLIPVSVIAKDYGYSAVGFNNLLHELRIQFKIGGVWLLYQKYADCGYTQSRTYYAGDKVSHVHTYWTHKGRLFLYETLKRYGILPLTEKCA